MADVTYIHKLPLLAATLSGGAQYVSAGSGLPNRITVANQTKLQGISNYYFDGPFWNPDSESFWVTRYADGNTIEKYDKAGNLQLTVILPDATPNPIGTCTYYQTPGTPSNNDRFFVTSYFDGYVHQYDFTGTQRQDTIITGGASNLFKVVLADHNLIWVQDSTGTFSEYHVAGSATGRVINAGFMPDGQPPGSMYGAPDYLWVMSSASILYQVQTSDLSIITTWSGETSSKYLDDSPGIPSLSNIVYVDNDGKPWVHDIANGRVTRWVAGGCSIGQTLIDTVIFWGTASLLRQSGTGYLSSLQYPNHCVLPSNDGTWIAYINNLPGDTGTQHSYGAICIGTQRARWNQNFTTNAIITNITVPGQFGNSINADYTFLRTRCFYSFDGGTTRTEFGQGSTMALAIIAGETITIDVDINEFAQTPSAEPFIGGDNGNGPAIFFSAPQPPDIPAPPIPAPSLIIQNQGIDGSDLDDLYDITYIDSFVVEFQNLAQRILRRLSTTTGALSTIDPDPNAAGGLNLQNLVNGRHSPNDQISIQAQVRAEVLKDQQVQDAQVQVVLGRITTINIFILTATGPFALTINVNDLTASILLEAAA